MVFSSPPRAAAGTPALAPGLRAFVDRYDVLLCDLWGVVHDGRAAFPAASQALVRFRAAGGTVVLITNAPRPQASVRRQIDGLGVPADAYDGIVTSGDVTIAAIIALGDQPLFHIGPPRDRALFDAVGERCGWTPRLTGLDDAAAVVATGLFDDSRESTADYVDTLAAARRRDLPMICANPDIVVHVGDTLVYCAGALAEAYAATGGRTVLAGKPHPPIYDAALAMAAEQRGVAVARSRVLCIGDGQVTDAAGAARQGLDMLFVSSGIHREALHPEGEQPLDPVRYVDRLAALEHPPMAALPALVW